MKCSPNKISMSSQTTYGQLHCTDKSHTRMNNNSPIDFQTIDNDKILRYDTIFQDKSKLYGIKSLDYSKYESIYNKKMQTQCINVNIAVLQQNSILNELQHQKEEVYMRKRSPQRPKTHCSIKQSTIWSQNTQGFKKLTKSLDENVDSKISIVNISDPLSSTDLKLHQLITSKAKIQPPRLFNKFEYMSPRKQFLNENTDLSPKIVTDYQRIYILNQKQALTTNLNQSMDHSTNLSNPP